MSELFGVNSFLDFPDLAKLLFRLAFNLFFAAIIIHYVYYRLYRNREYVFTYYLLNIITFSLCLLLRKVPAELGFALAIFAVFGILRFRTAQIRIRDLTYLFIVIGIGIINAIANKKISVMELLVVNVVIVGMTMLLELGPWGAKQTMTPLLYDNLELLKPGNRELLQDVRERTGLAVESVEIERIDLLRDIAELKVYHRKPSYGKRIE